MTLAFSTKIKGEATYFVEKVLNGLYEKKIINWDNYCDYIREYAEQNTTPFNDKDITFQSKIHTMRVDEKQRWATGMNIHFVINNRTKNRYQFAPVVKCVSKQRVVIHYWYNSETENFDDPAVYIDGKEILGSQLLILALNDGFDSVEDFFKYFNNDWKGWLIHWTNKKY